MAVMNEFQKERDAIKNGTWKQKFDYYFYYYKWHVIACILVIAFVISLVYTIATKKEPVLSGILLNAYTQDAEVQQTLIDDFMKEYEIDTNEYVVDIRNNLGFISEEAQKNSGIDQSAQMASSNIAESNYSTQQIMMAQIEAKELDFVTGDPSTMNAFYEGEFFLNLSEIFTEQQLEPYKDYLVYVDNVPAFLDVSHCKKLTDLYSYKHEVIYFGVICSTEHPDTLLNFIDFIVEE